MSDRPYIKPETVIPSAQGSPANGSSMAGNITSAPTVLAQKTVCSYSYSWTGTSPVGTISVQSSNDFSLNAMGGVANSGTWNTMTFNSGGSAVSSLAVSGNTGNGQIDITMTGVYAIRTVYTFSSGTGTLNATIVAKVS